MKADWLYKTKRLARLAASAAAIPPLLAKWWLHRLSRGRRFAGSRLDFHRLLLPKQLLHPIPGMTSIHERAFFEWYARRLFTGAGEIVDLGCWLGSTTASLARGLAANRAVAARERSIHAYDRFVWEPWMGAVAGDPLARRYAPGDSFLAAFEKRVAAWRERIEVRAGDLLEIGWQGGPIEFLLVDAMKSWELASGIVRLFYGAVTPGGYVLQQDFCHYFQFWVHPIHYRLREYLVPALDIPLSAGVVFQVRQVPPRELLETAYGPELFGDEEVESAFQWAMEIVSRDQWPSIAAARVRYLLEHAGAEAAAAALARYRSAGLSFHSDLRTMERQLAAAR